MAVWFIALHNNSLCSLSTNSLFLHLQIMSVKDNSTEGKFDGIHLLLWLIKDTLWVMGFKYATLLMIIPTVSYTCYLLYKNRENRSFFILYIAILFWLLGNSAWIVNDFFLQNKYNTVCYVFFILGILTTFFHILKKKNVS